MSLRDQVLKWIDEYRVYIAPSKINGVGLFAIDDIKKGEIVYSFLNKTSSVHCPISELVKDGVSEKKLNVFKRVFFANETRIQLKMTGISFVNYMNHSSRSNMEWSKENDLSIYKAKKDIKAGEEVTLDFLENNYHTQLNFKPNEEF